jgi:hypothetical protein
MNYDGYEILSNIDNYEAGLLKIDSFSSGVGAEGGSSTVRAHGHVNFVPTEIIVGSGDSGETIRILNAHEKNNDFRLPVWYKPDGRLTLDRYPEEHTLSGKRIWKSVLQLALFLNLPLPMVWLIDWRLRKKYKNEKHK